MTEATQEVPTTPTDELAPKKPKTKRGNRKRLLGNGEGDYCVYEVIPAGHPHMPAASLVPIPNIPRFVDTVKASKWIRQEGGDLLAGKQVMIFRAMEILDIQVQTKTSVVITAKPRKLVGDPKTDDKV